jgi:hypothetical protein
MRVPTAAAPFVGGVYGGCEHGKVEGREQATRLLLASACTELVELRSVEVGEFAASCADRFCVAVDAGKRDLMPWSHHSVTAQQRHA